MTQRRYQTSIVPPISDDVHSWNSSRRLNLGPWFAEVQDEYQALVYQEVGGLLAQYGADKRGIREIVHGPEIQEEVKVVTKRSP